MTRKKKEAMLTSQNSGEIRLDRSPSIHVMGVNQGHLSWHLVILAFFQNYMMVDLMLILICLFLTLWDIMANLQKWRFLCLSSGLSLESMLTKAPALDFVLKQQLQRCFWPKDSCSIHICALRP